VQAKTSGGHSGICFHADRDAIRPRIHPTGRVSYGLIQCPFSRRTRFSSSCVYRWAAHPKQGQKLSRIDHAFRFGWKGPSALAELAVPYTAQNLAPVSHRRHYLGPLSGRNQAKERGVE
jgi:hypothetical protein